MNRPLHYIADKKNPDNYIVKAFAFNDLYGRVDFGEISRIETILYNHRSDDCTKTIIASWVYLPTTRAQGLGGLAHTSF